MSGHSQEQNKPSSETGWAAGFPPESTAQDDQEQLPSGHNRPASQHFDNYDYSGSLQVDDHEHIEVDPQFMNTSDSFASASYQQHVPQAYQMPSAYYPSGYGYPQSYAMQESEHSQYASTNMPVRSPSQEYKTPPPPLPLHHPVFEHYSGSTIPDPMSVEIGGRMFQDYRNEKYFLPNDAVEQERLDVGHKMWLLIMDGKLNYAPINSPSRVLDIGCGTGLWAQEFAEKHPNAKVIGTDLSLIQPETTSAHPNLEFIREDVEDNWVWDQPFDYVHMRLMFTCFNDHRVVIRKIYDNLSPGGWLEYQDCSWSFDSDDEERSFRGTNLHRWISLMNFGGISKGRDMEASTKYKDYLEQAGFVDIVEKQVRIPGNPWPTNVKQRNIGKYALFTGVEVVQGLTLKLINPLIETTGISPEYVSELMKGAQKDWKDEKIKFTWPGIFVYGRKPFDHEVEPTKTTIPRIK